jgi:hypothetical protein
LIFYFSLVPIVVARENAKKCRVLLPHNERRSIKYFHVLHVLINVPNQVVSFNLIHTIQFENPKARMNRFMAKVGKSTNKSGRECANLSNLNISYCVVANWSNTVILGVLIRSGDSASLSSLPMYICLCNKHSGIAWREQKRTPNNHNPFNWYIPFVFRSTVYRMEKNRTEWIGRDRIECIGIE